MDPKLPGRFLCFLAITAAACGSGTGSSAPPPPGGGTSSSVVTVKGTEKIAWDQPAPDASSLDHYQYIAYVDGIGQVLVGSACERTSVAGSFPCSAALPKMTPGLHSLELAVREVDGLQLESPKSAPLQMNVVASTAATFTALSKVDVTSDGVRFVTETLATGLVAPSALAAAPDGRVFVAVRDGRILVWRNRAATLTLALQLDDVAQTADVGLMGMALDPQFSTNGLVFVAYAASDGNGGFVNRIVRLHDVNSSFGEPAVVLEDRVPAAAKRPPRIRVAADRTVYVVFPATDQAASESFRTYSGKLLRINEDGTTPKDDRGATPVISSGEAIVGGFDWQSRTASLWLSGRDWLGRDFIRELKSGPAGAIALEAPADPSSLAFMLSERAGGFAGDAFIGTLAGRYLRRVHFSETDPKQIRFTQRLLDGEIGRISDVVAAPDGSLFLCTSNTSAAALAFGDDRLLRLAALR